VRYRRTLALFIIALILGVVYFLYLKPAYEEKRLIAELRKRFFRSDTTGIDYIRIQAGTEPPYELKRRDGRWWITSPGLFMPDEGTLAMFMKTLSDGKVLKVVGSAGSLPEFGINKIYSVIAIGYRGNIEVLQVGEENPAGTGNYAFSERLRTVFLIDKETARHLYLKLYDIREKRLFPYSREQIDAISIERKEGEVELVRSGNGWFLRKPVLFRADENEMDTFLEILTTQKAEAFFPWSAELEGLKKIIRIGLRDRRGRVLSSGELRYWGTEWDKQAVFRRDDRPGEVMRVSRAFWLLLSSHASRFADGRVFAIEDREAVKGISIKYEGKEYRFERTGNEWRFGKRLFQYHEIYPLIDAVRRLSYEKLFFEKDYRFREPFFTLTVYTTHGDQRLRVGRVDVEKEVTSSFMFVPVKPGSPEKRRVRYWLSESNLNSYKGVINSEQIREIVESARKYENR
jgi:hypothetical protein